MIPEGAVEAGKVALMPTCDALNEIFVDAGVEAALDIDKIVTNILEAAAPFIQAQALVDAVDAFPLETIHAPDNAVVWMMRRADELRKGSK